MKSENEIRERIKELSTSLEILTWVLDSSTPAESVCECGHPKYHHNDQTGACMIGYMGFSICSCPKFTPVKAKTQDANSILSKIADRWASKREEESKTECVKGNRTYWQPKSKAVGERDWLSNRIDNLEIRLGEEMLHIDKRLTELEQFRKRAEAIFATQDVVNIAVGNAIDKLESKDTLKLLMPLFDEICRELRWPKQIQTELKKLKDENERPKGVNCERKIE